MASTASHLKQTASVFALLLATTSGMASAAGKDFDISALLPETGKTCATLENLKNPATPAQSYLSRLFYEAGISLEIPKMPGKEFRVCVDPMLNRMGMNGYYNRAADTMMLNPSKEVGEAERRVTAAHEMRHRQQDLLGVDPYQGGVNVPGHERVIMMFATEADARVEGVVLADKMRSLGHPEYVAKLMRSEATQAQMAAYDQSLRKYPGDVDRAKRAVVYAFLKDAALTQSYALEMVRGLPEGLSFRANRKVDSLAGDENLRKLGGYMNDALINDLRKSFSQADFDRLSAKVNPAPGIKYQS